MTDDHLDEQCTGGRDQGARHTERVYRPSRQDSCITPVERPSAVGNGALLPRCYALPAEPNSRSEEHTSELQSLMRISYAVFCLKKKKNIDIFKPYINNDSNILHKDIV